MLRDGVRSNNFLKIQLLSTVVGLVVATLNKIILLVMKKAVKFEKHEKVTREQSSIAQKFSLQIFMNSAIIIYIANIGLGNIWVEGGLISQVL